MDSRELLKIKDGLEKKKLLKASKEGQLESEKKKLKEDFGVNGSKEAKEKINALAKELDEIEESFKNKVVDFKEKFKTLLEG